MKVSGSQVIKLKSFSGTDEGSADAASAAPMGMKIALAYLLDCFEDYFHKKEPAQVNEDLHRPLFVHESGYLQYRLERSRPALTALPLHSARQTMLAVLAFSVVVTLVVARYPPLPV
jgi:hypothetical protein